LPITDEIYPSGLSLNALETYTKLDTILNDYNTSEYWKAHDITSYLYEEDVNGKKVTNVLKPEYGVGVKELTVVVDLVVANEPQTIKVPLLFGVDLLGRNGLKKIETEHPKILLITWMETVSAMCYAVVIETESAVGIWSNYHASVIFLNN
jgi:hypothetical protein